MTKKATRIPSFWSESVRSWFDEQLSRADLEKNRRARLVRLASDPQMKTVAEGLQRAEKRRPGAYDLSFDFLARALQAPELWAERKDIPTRNRDEELRVLVQSCHNFLRILNKERSLVVYWFGMIDKDRSHGSLHFEDGAIALNPYLTGRAGQRFSALLETIQGITEAVEHNIEGWPPPEYVVLPRKRRYKHAETVFCIQVLLRRAQTSFRTRLKGEVATIVTVLLGLDNPVTLERVKSISKGIEGGDWDEIP